LFYHKAVGDGGVGKDAKPLDLEATFWIASCTKLITSICALQQVEQGKVTLDEDVTHIVPELKDLPIITADGSSPDGYTSKPRTKPITLRQLLTHSSGIGYEFMSELIQKWRAKNGPPAAELAGKVNLAHRTPLLFEPGEGWSYGSGIDWAGIIVEKLNPGYTLDTYMAEKVFKPLGMTSTTFFVDRNPEILARLMPAATRQEDGTLTPSDTNNWPTKMEEASGGGGLWSSVTDYIKVLADLISPEPKLLKPETITTILAAPQLPEGSKALNQLVDNGLGAVASNAVALAGIPPISYGCGGLVTTRDTDVLPAKSLSWGGLPNLKWFLNRESGVAAMYATQILPYGDALSTELANKFFVEAVRLHKER
jgi:CubicO group peptidase (beta-lactamase class C family)